MQQSLTAAPAIDGCLVACVRTLDAVDQYEKAGGPYSAVGPHLRHCLDHVMCFLRGLRSGVIEYDARDRDVRVETDADYYREIVRHAMDQLAAISPATLANAITVCQISAPGAPLVTVGSTVERELLFLSGHTIHHLAIVTQIAKERGIAISPELSVAFSTAAHREALESESPTN
ncbi:MAG: DinB family protein [Candidatus Hydrogenedentes bacterium]|nr:DinB family protein [Candidatus Hydrogenedentota bacterium]